MKWVGNKGGNPKERDEERRKRNNFWKGETTSIRKETRENGGNRQLERFVCTNSLVEPLIYDGTIRQALPSVSHGQFRIGIFLPMVSKTAIYPVRCIGRVAFIFMCFSCPFTNFSSSLSCRLTPVVVRLGSVFAAWTEKETSAYSSPSFYVYIVFSHFCVLRATWCPRIYPSSPRHVRIIRHTAPVKRNRHKSI